MDDNHITRNGHIGSLPVKVCENMIDMLYSMLLPDQVEHTRALHSCALVCRSWRVRSQRNLFYSVVLHGEKALRRFVAVLDTGPHLCDYVREVTLIGHSLHTTSASPLSLFPVALPGKLPELRELSISRVREDEDWYPETSELEAVKSLGHLPLHPRFPLFLSAFATIASLSIYNVTFRHSNDIFGMMNALPALQYLNCEGVRCLTLGPLPMYAKPRVDASGMHVRPFASNLQYLIMVRTVLYSIGVRTRQYLCDSTNVMHIAQGRPALGLRDDIGLWPSSQRVSNKCTFSFRCTNGQFQ